jgi:Zn-dependent protease with chaperone function
VTYHALAVCLALAAFVSLNALGSLVAAAVWLAVRRAARRLTAAARAKVLFGLRTLPPSFALTYVAALLIPAYSTYEPYPVPGDEAVRLPLFSLAVLSAYGLARGACRAVSSWLVTRRLTARWLRHSEPLVVAGVNVPSYRLTDTSPVLAVVGVLRPRLFVASQVLDSLSPAELAVALAHERGHLLAHDTLRRAAMNLCRDLLPFIDSGRTLDRAWAEEAEMAADEYAARAGVADALDLAAALIKIARLMPEGVKTVVPAGAFLLEGSDDGLGGRVRQLTEMASPRSAPPGRAYPILKIAAPTLLLTFFTFVLVAAADPQVLSHVHALSERAVKLLS